MELTKEYLQADIRTTLFGRRIYAFGEIDSTNSCARALADVGAEEGTIVVAEYQTEGRGRLGRSWTAERGANLLFSALIRPALRQEQAGILPFFAAVAIARAIEPIVGQRVECKWPNDLLLDGKKFCGILLETAISEGRLMHAILGIGINVNQRAFPAPLLDTATSVAREKKKAVNRRDLFHSVLFEMESLYQELLSGNTKTILSEWLSRCTMIGKQISVRTGDEVVRGRALEVRETGALVLETPAGAATFFAADVTLADLPSPTRRT